MVLQAYKHLT